MCSAAADSGTSVSMGSPTSSSRVYPKSRSVAALMTAILPFTSATTMASGAASSRRWFRRSAMGSRRPSSTPSRGCEPLATSSGAAGVGFLRRSDVFLIRAAVVPRVPGEVCRISETLPAPVSKVSPSQMGERHRDSTVLVGRAEQGDRSAAGERRLNLDGLAGNGHEAQVGALPRHQQLLVDDQPDERLQMPVAREQDVLESVLTRQDLERGLEIQGVQVDLRPVVQEATEMPGNDDSYTHLVTPLLPGVSLN